MIGDKRKPNLRLRDERMLRHWSQQELADLVGATLNTVSRWERGLTECSPYFRNKLCELFAKDAGELGLLPEDERKSQSVKLFDPLLPAPRRLVGRDTLLQQLKELVCTNSEERIITLTGLPGVGKSALAIALAHDPAIQEHFSDGILWANLGPEPDIPALLHRWCSLLGIATNTLADSDKNDSWQLTLRTTMGMRRMLIIVDNVWQLENALAFLQTKGTYCTFLITTRLVNIALHLGGENALTIPELSQNDGLRLLSHLAPTAVKADPQSTSVLIRAVGGLPLALLLIGQYLRVQSHTQQPRRLSIALEWLREAEKRLRVEQPSLAIDQPLAGSSLSLWTTIAMSDHFLDQQAQKALRALSVFPAKPNTFSEQAATFVAGVSAEVLDHLSDANLLESQGAGRYSLHQCIADYAALNNPQEEAAHRLVEYFTNFVESQQKNYEALQLENINIFAALKLAYKYQQVISQIRIVIALFDFLETLGSARLTKENLPYLQCSIRTVEDLYFQVSTMVHLGKLRWIQDESLLHPLPPPQHLCLHLHELLIKNNQPLEKHIRECPMLPLLGVNMEELETYRYNLLRQLKLPMSLEQLDMQQEEDPLLVSQCLQHGLTLARQNEDAEQTCVILANLATIARRQKNYLEAERLLEDGLSIAARYEHNRCIALLLLEKIHLAFAVHKFDETSDVFQRVLELVPQEKLLATARYYGLAHVTVSTKSLT